MCMQPGTSHLGKDHEKPRSAGLGYLAFKQDVGPAPLLCKPFKQLSSRHSTSHRFHPSKTRFPAMTSTPVKRKATSPAGSPVPSKSTAANLPSSCPGSPVVGAAAAASSPPAEPANVDTVLTGALTGGHWLEQELPEDDTDGDSTLGSDAESSTASISSSIYAYRTINGRTYHSDSITNGEYWGPNDKQHLECLQIYHYAVDLMIDNKLHMAPISKDIKKALDIGTGEGLWAIDFADEFSKCEVIATDITPVQPQWVPPNLQFEINNAEKEWIYPPNDFDFVHIRFLDGAIEDWNALYREAYKVIKPGGWIEHLDHSPVVSSDDGSVKPGSAMDTYGKILAEAGKKMGRSITLADDDTIEEGLKAAGFINIQSKKYRVSRTSSFLSTSLYLSGKNHLLL